MNLAVGFNPRNRAKNNRRRVAPVENQGWQTHIRRCFITSFSARNTDGIFIATEIEGRIWAFMGGIALTHYMTAIQVRRN
jgi:hypothetical protein